MNDLRKCLMEPMIGHFEQNQEQGKLSDRAGWILGVRLRSVLTREVDREGDRTREEVKDGV